MAVTASFALDIRSSTNGKVNKIDIFLVRRITFGKHPWCAVGGPIWLTGHDIS